MQLADVLLDAGYAVAVALMDHAGKQDIAFAAVVRRVEASKPLVAFHRLPPVEDPPAVYHDAQFLVRYLDFVGRYDQLLHGFLRAMPPGSVHAVVTDALSAGAFDVAKKLGIPVYAFYATNASAAAVFLQLPTIRREGGQPSFRELGDTPLSFHGVPPMPASHLVQEVLHDPESEVYKVMMDLGRRISKVVDGILVNTFASLETRAVEALGDLLRRRHLPPVYCVGPLLAEAGGKEKEKHECLSWLDEQPERSVVYLCFGSIGTGNHSREQLKEIAVGLENSGHRFVWVVRAPPSDDDDPDDPRADPDLDALLPDGFLGRTSGRGLVLKLWAPQVEVLRHKATGAFVTHCGWNSVLEGVAAGVPMLCWPLYAEQKMNKVLMVEEAGIGAEVAGWQRGLVEAAEVEAKVRMLLESSEEGERLRAQVTALSKAAAAAWEDGGSSRAAFQRFLADAGDLKAQELRASVG